MTPIRDSVFNSQNSMIAKDTKQYD